jgi:hypothetical protein
MTTLYCPDHDDDMFHVEQFDNIAHFSPKTRLNKKPPASLPAVSFPK